MCRSLVENENPQIWHDAGTFSRTRAGTARSYEHLGSRAETPLSDVHMFQMSKTFGEAFTRAGRTYGSHVAYVGMGQVYWIEMSPPDHV